MEKVLFVLFAVAFIASMCFAEEVSDSFFSKTVASAGTTTFTGKVYSVLTGNSISKVKPQITVKDDNEEKATFMVASDATIIGKDGNSTTLNWIGKNDKVSIEYIADQDGVKTAKSIKVSANW